MILTPQSLGLHTKAHIVCMVRQYPLYKIIWTFQECSKLLKQNLFWAMSNRCIILGLLAHKQSVYKLTYLQALVLSIADTYEIVLAGWQAM